MEELNLNSNQLYKIIYFSCCFCGNVIKEKFQICKIHYINESCCKTRLENLKDQDEKCFMKCCDNLKIWKIVEISKTDNNKQLNSINENEEKNKESTLYMNEKVESENSYQLETRRLDITKTITSKVNEGYIGNVDYAVKNQKVNSKMKTNDSISKKVEEYNKIVDDSNQKQQNKNIDTNQVSNFINIDESNKSKKPFDPPKRDYEFPGVVNNTQEKQNLVLLQCPKCLLTIEFLGGCNLINCISPFCMSKNVNFCRLCRQVLSNSNKQSHYPDGLTAPTCINSFKRNKYFN
jgi:hypothetical protein